MAAIDLITLADLKEYKPLTGDGRDPVLAQFITVASRTIEDELGRRIVYRAPTESAALVYSGAWASGSPAVSAQPASAGRTLIVTFPANASTGTLTVVGTVAGVAGVSRVFDVEDGLIQHGLDFFSAVSAITIAGALGSGTVTVGTSVGYVEFHTAGGFDLWPYEWPVGSINEINEDPSRTYGVTTRLVNGTDYTLTHVNVGDRLVRLSGPYRWSWMSGYRTERLTYSSGYTRSTVPSLIKDACKRLALMLYQEVDQGRIEVASGSNAMGSWSRFGPAGMTPAIRAQLGAYRRNRFGSDTAEIDANLPEE